MQICIYPGGVGGVSQDAHCPALCCCAICKGLEIVLTFDKIRCPQKFLVSRVKLNDVTGYNHNHADSAEKLIRLDVNIRATKPF